MRQKREKAAISTERVLVIPDLQIPLHLPKAVANVTRFISDYQPDRIVGIGDHVDCQAPARWNRGTAEEYVLALQAEVDEFKKIFGRIREVYSGPIGLHTGNHEARIQKYIKEKAPAFSGLKALELSSLLGYEELGIEELPKFHPIAPGWLSTHGDAGGHSKYGGGKAIGIAVLKGKSVVCGDSHRMGLVGRTTGEAGKQTTLWGFEVGNLMDMRKATYLKADIGNWQLGLGILEITGNDVNPIAVPVKTNGSFTYAGTKYA